MNANLRALSLACAVALAAGGLLPSAYAQNTPATRPAEPRRDLTEVPVRRVVLFSSGVGFFQHAGRVSGNAATELRFKTEQINDILKSLVVSDASSGIVKSITYGSQNPVSRTLKSFQIDISSNPSLSGILNQVRGTRARLEMGDEKIEGTILGVEEKDRPLGVSKDTEGKVVKVSYVNVITSTGIRSIQLDEVKRLELLDDALQKELEQALAALAQARDQNKKPVIVNFEGTGDRQVGVAYLVETPVWKTSYRLILPDASSRDTATLLGWAIVENQTDNDWNDVTLDLVGGRPISFIQDLYQPLYVPRPRVAPKTYASLTPQTYEEGLVGERDRQMLTAQAAMPAAPAPSAAPMQGRGGRGGGGAFGGAAGARRGFADDAGLAKDVAAEAEGLPSDFSQGVRSLADASKVGEMFQYSVAGVSLPRQRSSMIPIISERVPFDRVSIYNHAVLARNALLGVRLKNQSRSYLLSGPLTLLDKVRKPDGNTVDSYAGDANVDDVPPGQERLLSYAVDQELLVDATNREGNQRLLTGSIVQGVLHLKYTDGVTQTYLLDNKAEREKSVIIEHPVQAGFELKEPVKALEKTEKVYRFQLPIAAKAAGKFQVREERVRLETLAILNIDFDAIDFYVRNGAIPQKVKDALQGAAERRRSLADLERRLATREQERTRLLQDQANIRENIRVLPATSKSREDAINDLSAKDTALKTVSTDMDKLRQSIEEARKALNTYLNEMNVE